MIKIYDEETQKYLKSCGVSQKEIDKIKFTELKKAVLIKLDMVRSLINDNKFGEIDKYIGYSPAGDEMGCDNNYICFDEFLPEDTNGTDISSICCLLASYKQSK